MAIPFHTHTFTIPTATKQDVIDRNRNDLSVTPDSLGSAASADRSDFATAAQGAKADTALQPGDIPNLTGPIEQFLSNGFPNHQSSRTYSKGSYVRYITGNGAAIYRSRIDNNSSPPTNTANWERVGGMAFKDQVALSDIQSSGTASQTSFLRGDGQWTDLGSLAYKNLVGRPDLNMDGPPEIKGVNNVVTSDGTGTLYWSKFGTIAPIDLNNNPNMFINGQGVWAMPPSSQPTGLWWDLNTPYQDENIYVRLANIDPEKRFIKYGMNFYKNVDITYCNSSGMTNAALFAPENGVEIANNFAFINIPSANHHYHISNTRMFIDKR